MKVFSQHLLLQATQVTEGVNELSLVT